MTGKITSVVENPSVTRAVYLQRGGPVPDSTETAYQFDPPEKLQLFVTGATREDREALSTGTDATIAYKMAAMSSRNVTEGDRVWFDDSRPNRGTIDGVPIEANAYRVGVPQTATLDDERFVWVPLSEDGRGDASGSDSTDGSGSDGSDSGSNDGPRLGS